MGHKSQLTDLQLLLRLTKFECRASNYEMNPTSLMFAVLSGPQYCAVRWPTWRTSVSPILYTRPTRDLLHLRASLSLRGTELRHLAGVLSSYTPLERFSGDKVIIISLYICILGNKHYKLSTISNVKREFSFIRFKLPIWEFGLSKISVLTLGSHW